MNNLPETLFFLREEIERKLGCKPDTPENLKEFCERFNEELRKASLTKRASTRSLSEKTLDRMWERDKYQSTPSRTTLNCLAKVGGYRSWDDFEEKHVANMARITYATLPELASAEIADESYVCVGSYPRCYVYFRHISHRRFKTLKKVGEWKYVPGEFCSL